MYLYRPRLYHVATGLIVGLALLLGCDSNRDGKMPTRPVTVIELTERDNARERELTGVVSLYREERIGFEIGGRVTTVLEKGLEVQGPAFNENGRLIRQGDAIATMEGTRYGSQVGALHAQLDAARRDLQAIKAQVTLTRQTLERQRRVLVAGAGSEQAVDDSKSAFDQATAHLAARRAAVRAAGQQLTRATEDLGDAVLHAPFSGRITEVHVSEGAVVTAGTPIVTLTLMDPVRIQLEVSSDYERELETGDRAMVYPKDPFDVDKRIPVNAIVFEKSAVADPQLRTFRIDLIARNLRRHIHDRDPTLSGLPSVNDYLPVVREFQGEPGPLFVHSNAVFTEDGKTYVLRLPGVSFHAGAERSAVGRHVPERVQVTLGDQYTTVVNWNFRSVEDDGALAEGDFLIINPRPDYVNGVAIGRPHWLLRPRALVPVRFNLSASPVGFYVPNSAIILLGDTPNVYRVENGFARATPVSPLETVDEYRRIQGEGLADGVRIIVGGVHYVSDGQPVSVTEVVE